MAEVDPAVLAERVLRMKSARLFDSFDLADVAILAAAGRDQLCRDRTQLVAEGERASAHWVALTGGLRALHRGKPVPGDLAAKGIGGLSVLTGRPMPCDLFADPGSVLLVLDADALMSTLEERGRIARAMLQGMARSALALGAEMGKPAGGPCVVAPRGSARALDLVSRMVVVKKAVALGARHGSALLRLARAARSERVPAGATLWPDCRAPSDLVIVLEGAVDTPPRWQPDQNQSAVYGLMEALASVPPETAVLATEETTTLVVRHAEIREALEDDDGVCLELIRRVALEHWRLFWDTHPLPQVDPEPLSTRAAL
jgi:hypothetical protein